MRGLGQLLLCLSAKTMSGIRQPFVERQKPPAVVKTVRRKSMKSVEEKVWTNTFLDFGNKQKCSFQ